MRSLQRRLMKRHNMTDEHHHHFLWASKECEEMESGLVDGPLCLFLLRFSLEIPFTHSACKSRTLFNEIKILLPFHSRIYVHLHLFKAHSFCLLRLLQRRLDLTLLSLNEILFSCFYQTTIAELLRNTFFHSLRAKRESKANRWEKNFICRPVFLDRVLFFFQFVRSFPSYIKIPCSSSRDTFIHWIRETIVKVEQRMLVLLHRRDGSCNFLAVKLSLELSKL